MLSSISWETFASEDLSWRLYCYIYLLLFYMCTESIGFLLSIILAFIKDWIVILGNYPCGIFSLIHCSPESGLAFLPSIFISIFSLTGFAGRSYLVEVSLSSLHPFSPRTNPDSPTVHREAPSCFGVSWGRFGWFRWGDTWGFFRVSEKETSPICQPFFFCLN